MARTDWYPDLFDDLQATHAATWTDIPTKAFFTSAQALRAKILDIIGGREKDSTGAAISPPYAVYEIGAFANEMEWGANNNIKRMPLRIWRVEKMQNLSAQNKDMQEYLHGKLYSMAEAINSDASKNWKVVEEANINTSADNSANTLFFDSQLQCFAGYVEWEPGLLVGTGS